MMLNKQDAVVDGIAIILIAVKQFLYYGVNHSPGNNIDTQVSLASKYLPLLPWL